jgi:hypothetical protein
MHIYSMEKDGEVLPPVTYPPFEDVPEGGIIMPIIIFPDIISIDASLHMAKAARLGAAFCAVIVTCINQSAFLF